MLLLEGYISNFTCARYYFLYVEFCDFYVNQSLAGQTILSNILIKLYLTKYTTQYFLELRLITYPTSTRRHGNFAGVHTLLRIILSSNSAVLINIITGVSPPHFDFFVFYVLCQC
jgi:hypothetical protein